MPEDAALAVAADGIVYAFEGFVHGEVLVVASENLDIFREQDEVLQKADEACLGKHAV